VADENANAKQLTAVITGASSGIGAAAAVGLARRGVRLALVGRDQRRLEETISNVRAAAGAQAQVTAYRADFAELSQVRDLAGQLAAAYPRIDLLANNAGLLVPGRVTTVDGFELTVQANHLAPFLLTHLLRDRLAGGRVVTTASDAHRGGRLDPADLDSRSGPYKAFTVYGSSKQANIAFAAEAARRWPDILSFAYHPGVVRTRFGRDSAALAVFYRLAFFLRSPEKGADTLLWLAQAPAGELENGGYYVDRVLKQATPATTDPALAAKVWDASAAAVGLATG
jgi:NAD(P)-dependent dehydrogenase (short-subunit alcohol dehydrogenase family)